MELQRKTRDEIAIVGAGMAGLSCAQVLAAAGCSVTIFEQSRGLGGRCSTSKLPAEAGPEFVFDHGAQYFTVRDPGFAELVGRWREDGRVQVWQPRLWAVDGTGGPRGKISAGPVEDAVERLVAVPDMSALGRSLRAEIDDRALTIQTKTRIAIVRREKFDWELEDEAGRRHGGFGFVVLDLPAPQAVPLLAGHAPRLQARAQACRFDPCWTLMFAPAQALELDFDAAFVSGSPLAWIADNSTKPGRPPVPCWVAQASGEWSTANFERDPDEVAAELLASFRALVGRPVEARHTSTQRWPHAKPEPLPEPFLYDRIGIGACGDWCGGPRVEGAFVSGQALAEAILSA